MKKRMLFLVLLFFAVLVIPMGTQITNVSVVNAESQQYLELACEPDPPALPDPADYTYHTYIDIDIETWDDVIEEFDGMGTRWSPLKIRGLYFEGNPSTIYDPRINIDTSLDELEDIPYIDIEDCLFIGDYSDPFTGVLSRHVTGRIRIKDCIFINNTYGIYLDNVEGMSDRRLIVKDCLFYEGSGAGVYIYGDDGGADITVKDCTFYAVETGVYANWLFPGSRLEITGCDIYSYILDPYWGYNVLVHGVIIFESIGEIVISNNHIAHARSVAIDIRQCTQGVTVKDNEISHCSDEVIKIHNGASFNIITDNYIHDLFLEHIMGIAGHHNIIKSNKFEGSDVAIYCYPDSYENEIIWNLFLEPLYSPWLVTDLGEGNLWDFNYYYDYEGDGKEPYDIPNWPEMPEVQDLHPLGPNVPYIPPTPPDRADYTYHASIWINAETLEDVIEEFDGMGTRWNPLKIRGFYFEDTGGIGQSHGVFINSDLEDVYIDIEDCLFIGYHSYSFNGVLSYPSSGRIRIKDCVFIDNRYGVYLSEHAEQIVEDCLFYGGSVVGQLGAGVFLEEAFDVIVKECTFYAVERGILAEWLSPTSRFEVDGCNIYGSIWGVKIEGSIPGEDGAIVIMDNHIDYCSQGIEIRQGSQGVIVNDNEISHCTNPILIDNGASFNIITGNYIHDSGDESGMAIEGHHNIIKSNKFEDSNFEITIYCYPWSYENEITWNVFIETSTSAFLVADSGEGNLWDYNYYSDYEGDGTEPYDIGWPELGVQDLHPLGPELTFYFWLELFLQYPSEVFQMWRWLI